MWPRDSLSSSRRRSESTSSSRNRARTVVYSTGLPPSAVAAAIAALDLIEREPDYAALPVKKAKAFTRRRIKAVQ